MPPRKSVDKYEVLKGNAVIVFLYLLHYPDYAYNITKTFEEISDKKKLRVPLALMRYSNVHAILRQLKEADLLKTEESVVKEKSRVK